MDNKSRFILKNYFLVVIVFCAGMFISILLFNIAIQNNLQFIEKSFKTASRLNFEILKTRMSLINKQVKLFQKYGEVSIFDEKFGELKLVMEDAAIRDKNTLLKVFSKNFTDSERKKIIKFINEAKILPGRVFLKYGYLFVVENSRNIRLIVAYQLKSLILSYFSEDELSEVYLFDSSDKDFQYISSKSDSPLWLNYYKEKFFLKSPYKYSKEINFFDKKIQVIFVPEKSLLSSAVDFLSWVVLTAATVMTILICIFMHIKVVNNFSLRNANLLLRAERNKLAKLFKKQEKANKQLSLANDDLDHFLHMVSHDLKEPLRGIMFNSSVIKEDYRELDEEEARSRLDRIMELSTKSNELIDKVGELSKISVFSLQREKVDSYAVINTVISTVQELISKNNVKIIIQKNMPKHINANGLFVKQVFYNLIVNAIKYNDKAEKIVRIGFNKRRGKFFIRDNGKGVENIHHMKIFKMFKRLEKADSSGIGAGLALVKKIITRHEGEISVESEVGKGSVFYFTFDKKS